MVHSEARTRLDNMTKIQSSNAWISSWNAQMLHFPLCRESVLGMPRIEIEFEFDMVFCFGIRLALYAVVVFFHSDLPSTHCTTFESNHPINIEFVRPSVLPSSVYECRAITLQPLGIDLCNFKIEENDVHLEKTQTRLRTRKASLVDLTSLCWTQCR